MKVEFCPITNHEDQEGSIITAYVTSALGGACVNATAQLGEPVLIIQEGGRASWLVLTSNKILTHQKGSNPESSST
jgi:hypothetical protein